MIKLEPNVNRQVEHSSVFGCAMCTSTSNAVRFIYCIRRWIWIDVIWTITRTTPERTFVYKVNISLSTYNALIQRTPHSVHTANVFFRRTTNGWSGFKMFGGNFISGSRFVHPNCRKWPLCQQLYAFCVECELIFHHKVYAFNSNFQFYTMLHTSHRVDCRNENANAKCKCASVLWKFARTCVHVCSVVVHRSSFEIHEHILHKKM